MACCENLGNLQSRIQWGSKIISDMREKTLNDITIVIGCYNSGQFIADTLYSALACKPGRIVIADDASTDDTLAIAEEILRNGCVDFSIIRSAVNRGLTRNWNVAITRVTTPYCLKLDHDDIIVPAYVRAAVDFLRDHPSVGIIAGKAQIFSNGSAASSQPIKEMPANASIQTFRGTDACRMVLAWNPYACSSSTIYKMSAWNEVRGFDEHLCYCNDREIWFRLAVNHDLAFYHGVAALQRIHEDNFTKTVRRREAICYELDHMFTTASKTWNSTELRGEFRKALRCVARNYFGSAIRSATRRPWEVPCRIGRGLMALGKSC
jgi:glycosyltransferase involved in cell wall biosynthesis